MWKKPQRQSTGTDKGDTNKGGNGSTEELGVKTDRNAKSKLEGGREGLSQREDRVEEKSGVRGQGQENKNI